MVRASVVEVLQQRPGDRLAAAKLAEEAVVIDAVDCEQGGERGAVVGAHGLAKARQQFRKVVHAPPCFPLGLWPLD